MIVCQVQIGGTQHPIPAFGGAIHPEVSSVTPWERLDSHRFERISMN
jgi:hypothetical protein